MPTDLQSEPGRKRLADGSAVDKPYVFGSPNISQFVDILTQVQWSSMNTNIKNINQLGTVEYC